MNIQNKIEEIRQKPEHVRMRYVIGCASAVMLVFFIFWIFSVKVSLQKSFSKDSETCSDENGTCNNPDILNGFLPQDNVLTPSSQQESQAQ